MNGKAEYIQNECNTLILGSRLLAALNLLWNKIIFKEAEVC